MRAVHIHMVRLSKEIEALVKAALEISYFSRGAWTYEQVLGMSAGIRDLAVDFVNERLKAASKMPFPVF